MRGESQGEGLTINMYIEHDIPDIQRSFETRLNRDSNDAILNLPWTLQWMLLPAVQRGGILPDV